MEGRVAGALYDLWDPVNEPIYDSATFGLGPFAKVTLQGPQEVNFLDFWNGWKTSGQNKHNAVRAIYQNTIDYNTAPFFDPPLPSSITVLQNSTWTHAIDLWDYPIDNESTDAELFYHILSQNPPSCGVSLDSHWINLAPQTNFLGSCDVIIEIYDGIATTGGGFSVNVEPVRGRVYLPIILK